MPIIVVDKSLAVSDPERFEHFGELAHRELVHLSALYPNFDAWYGSKVQPGLMNGTRKLLLKYVGENLGGIAIAKITPEERKLCCLRVLSSFKGSGLGLRLFKDAFGVLETEKPLLSVSEESLPEFLKVFDYFSFEMAGEYESFYRKAKKEYSFNGILTKTE